MLTASRLQKKQKMRNSANENKTSNTFNAITFSMEFSLNETGIQ